MRQYCLRRKTSERDREIFSKVIMLSDDSGNEVKAENIHVPEQSICLGLFLVLFETSPPPQQVVEVQPSQKSNYNGPSNTSIHGYATDEDIIPVV